MTEYLLKAIPHGRTVLLRQRRPAILRGRNRNLTRYVLDLAGDLGAATSLELQQKIESLQDSVKEEMIKTAAAQGAANVALVIGLNAYPIVGNALSAALAATQAIAARYNKAKMEGVMDDLKNRLEGLAAATKANVKPYADQAIRDETPAAAILALSGQPLSGLGSVFTDARDFLREKVGTVTRQVATVALKPIAAVGIKAPLRLVEAGASAAGVDKVAEIAAKGQDATNTFTDKTIDKSGQYAANPLAIVKDAQTVGLTVTGYEAVKEADQKSGEVWAAAVSQMAAAQEAAIKELQSPGFRAQLRKTIAQKMLDDPGYANAAAIVNEQLNAQKGAIAKKFGLGTGLALGAGVVALGVIAYLLLRKPSRR